MLVLMRHQDESVLIGPDIEVVVLDVVLEDPLTGRPLDRPRVQLGIKAPRSLTVLRNELVERKEAS